MSDLLTLAVEVLRSTGAGRLILERDGVRVTVEGVEGVASVLATPAAASRSPSPAGLSPLETKILAALTPDWRTAMELADATGEACSNHFRSILSNLGERKLLESSKSGYRQIPGGIPTPASPCSVRMFSPDEETIMAVASRDWLTATEIAQRAGMSKSTSFSAILANLVERGALESGRAGYRIPRVSTATENGHG